MRSAVRIGEGEQHDSRRNEEGATPEKKKPCSSDQPTAARWVTARHPCGAPVAPSALRMVNSARNVADRITSTWRAWRGWPTKPRFEETDELYDEQTAAFAKLYTVVMDSADDGLRTLHLTHHLYDDMCDLSGRDARLARSRASTLLSPTSANITKRWAFTFWTEAHLSSILYLPVMPIRAVNAAWSALASSNKWALVQRTSYPYRWRYRLRTTREFVFSELWWSHSPITVALGDWIRAKSRTRRTPRNVYFSPTHLAWTWAWSRTSSQHSGRSTWRPLNCVTALDAQSRRPCRPHSPCRWPRLTEQPYRNT